MARRIAPEKLLPPAAACFYLTGEDADALFEAGEALLTHEADGARILRVDVDELERVLENLQPGLFGERRCHALVRNAQSAKPRQIDQLEKWVAAPPAGLRLVICAPGVEARRAVHKRLTALPQLLWCVFPKPDAAHFRAWLQEQVQAAGLEIEEEAFMLLAERLQGMRAAARQAIERLRLYDGGEGVRLDMEVVASLLGERAPPELGAYCHAVALRSPEALSMLRRLLREQRLPALQVLAWLSTRMQQLLLYRWHARWNAAAAAARARLFGEAREQVPKEARHWRGRELIRVMERIAQAEMQLKGASLEDEAVVMERLTLRLISAEV